MIKQQSNVRIYGCKNSRSSEDVASMLRDITRKTTTWCYHGAVILSVDIKTAFDKTEHDSLHRANRALQITLLAQLPCMKDYAEKTATFTLPGGHTTLPFPVDAGEFNHLPEFLLRP